MAIFDRLASLAGTDVGQALGSAHEHFQDRINTHGHFGRALIESIAHFCRNHPNLAGIAVGVIVEQLLVREKHHHDQEVAEGHAGQPHGGAVPLPRAAPHHTPHHLLQFSRIHPVRIALEVFGALVLMKFTLGIARIFSRHKRHSQASMTSVARIKLFSATFAAYYVARILKTHEVSAGRNALAVFFATNALKPLLRPDYRRLPPEPPRPHAPAAEPGFSLAPELHPPEQSSSLFH